MSQIPGLVYLIEREGEDGKIGKIRNALQVKEGSPIIEEFTTNRRFYIGSKEDWEEFMADHQNPDAVAGDMDADGDFDSADRKIIDTL